jgi:hypothetical protein
MRRRTDTFTAHRMRMDDQGGGGGRWVDGFGAQEDSYGWPGSAYTADRQLAITFGGSTG